MNDKHSFAPLLAEHAELFGKGALESASADKGYWSTKNQGELIKQGVRERGLQPPANLKKKCRLASLEVQQRLRDRRAGIEPWIGHTKAGGQLGKSRMKSDAASLAAGYASVLGFNLRQLSRAQGSTSRKAA